MRNSKFVRTGNFGAASQSVDALQTFRIVLWLTVTVRSRFHTLRRSARQMSPLQLWIAFGGGESELRPMPLTFSPIFDMACLLKTERNSGVSILRCAPVGLAVTSDKQWPFTTYRPQDR